MDQELILVNDEDEEIGTLDRATCHKGDGVLHRAFSLFVFDPAGRLFLQQRSDHKELWPLHWSNSCCSHPRAGETMEAAVPRRLEEELGIECAMRFLYKFRYQARDQERGSEHELCSVYSGVWDGSISANPEEIAASRWVTREELDREMGERPDEFTPWFQLEWPRVREAITSR